MTKARNLAKLISDNMDFRVESDSETHALFVDASNSGVVGFGTSAPRTTPWHGNRIFTHISNNTSGANPAMMVTCHDTDEASLILGEQSGSQGYAARLYYEGAGNNFFNIRITDVGVEADPIFSIHRDNRIGINETDPDLKLHITGTGISDGERGLLIQSTNSGGYAESRFKTPSREFRIGVGGASSQTDLRDRLYFYTTTGNKTIMSVDANANMDVDGNVSVNALEIQNDFSYYKRRDLGTDIGSTGEQTPCYIMLCPYSTGSTGQYTAGFQGTIFLERGSNGAWNNLEDHRIAIKTAWNNTVLTTCVSSRRLDIVTYNNIKYVAMNVNGTSSRQAAYEGIVHSQGGSGWNGPFMVYQSSCTYHNVYRDSHRPRMAGVTFPHHAESTYQWTGTLGAGSSTYVAAGFRPYSAVYGTVYISSGDSDYTDHFDVAIGPTNSFPATWQGGSADPTNPADYNVIHTHLGDSQNVSVGYYGVSTPSTIRTDSAGGFYVGVQGNNATVRVQFDAVGYFTK